MRILHVINSLPTGGAEKLLTELVPLQIKEGDQVDVIRFAPGETDFARRLKDAGVKVLSLGHREKDIYNPLLVFKLMRYINRYDIVHVHLFPAQYWVAIAAWLMRSKVCLVTTEHSTSNRRRPIRILRWVDRLIYHRYSAIIAISDKVKQSLNYLCENDRIYTVDNGIDVTSIQQAQPISLSSLISSIVDVRVLIVQVARFSAPKDQDSVIRAMSLLPRDFHLVFVGDGIRRAECESLSADLHLTSRVHFIGERVDVPKILKRADIVVMSSHYEGFGLAAIEGMAAGKPVIASDVPGMAEVVKGAGVLFPKGDVKMLATAIKRLADDPIYYAEIKAKCIERAKCFDIHIMKKQYDEIYHKTMNRSV